MNQERVFQVLVAPHVSEKAAILADQSNQYVFRVALNATKAEIKKSVEQLFKVKVEDVRTLKVKGKVKRNRYGYSTKPAWKKAYVRLAQGQDIDFAEA
ncbi:MAG: 50S ribosomal protein L23 [Halioglobus sp.]|jgi:large subunit ribosomal protein L23